MILIDVFLKKSKKHFYYYYIKKEKWKSFLKNNVSNFDKDHIYIYVSIKLILFVKNVYFKDLTMQIEFNWNSIEQENGERLLKSALKYRGKGKRFWFFHWKKKDNYGKSITNTLREIGRRSGELVCQEYIRNWEMNFRRHGVWKRFVWRNGIWI